MKFATETFMFKFPYPIKKIYIIKRENKKKRVS